MKKYQRFHHDRQRSLQYHVTYCDQQYVQIVPQWTTLIECLHSLIHCSVPVSALLTALCPIEGAVDIPLSFLTEHLGVGYIMFQIIKGNQTHQISNHPYLICLMQHKTAKPPQYLAFSHIGNNDHMPHVRQYLQNYSEHAAQLAKYLTWNQWTPMIPNVITENSISQMTPDLSSQLSTTSSQQLEFDHFEINNSYIQNLRAQIEQEKRKEMDMLHKQFMEKIESIEKERESYAKRLKVLTNVAKQNKLRAERAEQQLEKTPAFSFEQLKQSAGYAQENVDQIKKDLFTAEQILKKKLK